jgi:putative membrane protein
VQPKTTTWYAAGLGLLVAISAVSSCKANRSSDTASGAADPGAAATTQTDTAQAPTEAGLSDPNIVALLDEANMADSAAGAFAVGKATDPDVKAFARLMMGEHHALRAEGQQLAQRLNVTPQPPPNDPVKTLAESEMAALKAAPKGREFDRTYIEQEVAAHKAVLDLAEKAHGSTQNEELKKLIERAKPVIEKHLARAEEIQKKLGKASA